MAIRTHIVPDETRQKWQRFYEGLDTAQKPGAAWLEQLPLKKDGQLVKLLKGAVKNGSTAHVIAILEEAANRCIGLHSFEDSFYQWGGKKSLSYYLVQDDLRLYDVLNEYDILPAWQGDYLGRYAWQNRDADLLDTLIKKEIRIMQISDDDLVDLVGENERDVFDVLIKAKQLDEKKLKRVKAVAAKLQKYEILHIAQNALANLETPTKKEEPSPEPIKSKTSKEWFVISPECISRTLKMPDNITRQQVFDFAAGRIQTLTYTKANGKPTNIAEREEAMDWKGNSTLLQMAFNTLKDQGGNPTKTGGPTPIEKKRPRIKSAAAKNS